MDEDITENIQEEFISPQKQEIPCSNFNQINLNFGDIRAIEKDSESKFDKFLDDYKDLYHLNDVDINQIVIDEKYNSDNIKKKLEKILNMDDFLLYFKEPNKIKITNDKTKIKSKKDKNYEENNEKINLKTNPKKEEEMIENKEKIELKKKDIKKKRELKKEECIKKQKQKEELKDKAEEKEEEKKEEEEIKIQNKNNNKNMDSIDQRPKSQNINKESKLSFTFDLSQTSDSKSNTEPGTIENLTIDIQGEGTPTMDRYSKKLFVELNSKNEDKFDRKDYEAIIKNNFKIFLDYCSNQDLTVESCASKSFSFIYKIYNEMIKLKPILKEKNIIGEEKTKGIVEFDVLVRNMKKKTLENFVKTFNGNIICSSNIDKLDDTKNYQIIGEVAKNILVQSPDKINQINKYVDIILINNIMKKEKISKINLYKMNFKSLKLNFDDEKIIMIITDGSYFELLKAVNSFNKKEKELQNLKSRDKKNIQDFKKIIDNSKIHYIIFFMPSDLKNNIDNYLIEHIKSKNLNNKINSFKKDIYHNYFYENINKEIKSLKAEISKEIISLTDLSEVLLNPVCDDLYNNIIDNITSQTKFNITIVLKEGSDKVENIIFLHFFVIKNNFINCKILTKKNEIDEYMNNQKKIGKNDYTILICKKDDKYDNLYNQVENDHFSKIMNENEFNSNYQFLIKEVVDKISNYFGKEIDDIIYKNCLYYEKNDEYMNPNNLQQKIINDLNLLKCDITFNNNSKNIVDSDSFKNIMKLPEHLKMNIESLYNKNFSENSRIFIDLKQSHFDYCKKNLRKVFEEFFCWSIYKYFFGKYFIKKIILKNLIN